MRITSPFLSLILFAGFAGAQQQGNSSSATELVSSGYGLDTFLIATPDASSSQAARLNDDRADGEGTVPAPTEGYVLGNQVVVQTEDVDLLVNLARSADENAQISAHALAGFYLVEVQTVADAIDMTWVLEPVFGAGKVHLDVEVRRFDAESMLLTSFRSLWVLTNEGGQWAAKMRSSFASK